MSCHQWLAHFSPLSMWRAVSACSKHLPELKQLRLPLNHPWWWLYRAFGQSFRPHHRMLSAHWGISIYHGLPCLWSSSSPPQKDFTITSLLAASLAKHPSRGCSLRFAASSIFKFYLSNLKKRVFCNGDQRSPWDFDTYLLHENHVSWQALLRLL